MRIGDLPVGATFKNAKGHRGTVEGHMPTGTIAIVTADGKKLQVPPSMDVTPDVDPAAPEARLDGVDRLRQVAIAEGRTMAERRKDVADQLRHLSSDEIEQAASLNLPLWVEALLRTEVQRRTAAQADQRAPASRHLADVERLQERMNAAETAQDRADLSAELLRRLQTALIEEPARSAVWMNARALAQRIAQNAAREIAAGAASDEDAVRQLGPLVAALIPDDDATLGALRRIAPDADPGKLATLAPYLATTATLTAAVRLDSGLTADDLDLLHRLESGGRARQSALSSLRKAAKARRLYHEPGAIAAPVPLAASTSPQAPADAPTPTPEPTAANSGHPDAPAQVPTQAPEVPTEAAEVPTVPTPAEGTSAQQSVSFHVIELPDGYDRWAKIAGRPAELVDEVRAHPDRLVIRSNVPGTRERCRAAINDAFAAGRRVEIQGAEPGEYGPPSPPDAPSLDVLLSLVRERAAAAGFVAVITLTPSAP